jgi:hypothetical protein
VRAADALGAVCYVAENQIGGAGRCGDDPEQHSMTMGLATPADGAAASAASAYQPDLRLFVFALFFVFGGITSLNDVLIPKLKSLFTLSYADVMLVQSAFFAAYLRSSPSRPPRWCGASAICARPWSGC